MKTMTKKTVFVGVLAGATLLLSGCEFPIGVETDQKGYRGLGLEQVKKSYLEEAKRADINVPAPQPPAMQAGPKARDIYQSVQVLGDLHIAEFNRVMNAITEWVAPQEGCNYCHVPGNFADDGIYTKVVARRMMEMTKTINTEWKAHVADTGVTCFTCHLGQPVPRNIWFENPGPNSAGGMSAQRMGHNTAGPNVASAALPNDVFTAFLADNPREIRVTPHTALPEGTNPALLRDAEWTHGLMIFMSKALGANCTTCHNTRNFPDWSTSPPQRVTAWHGIQMVRALNVNFLNPLQPVFPENRLGPLGDAPKANCATCHNGLQLPLDRYQMLAEYPELNRIEIRGSQSVAETAPTEAAADVEVSAEVEATDEVIGAVEVEAESSVAGS